MIQSRTIRPMSRAEAIVQHFISRIQKGEFGPGDKLPSERNLQQELGVGRLTLREGLARLSALGIIRVDHGKGAFVQDRACSDSLAHAMTLSFSEQDQKAMEDLFHTRELIEGELTSLAARNRQSSDIVKLAAILNNPDGPHLLEKELADLDLAFHLEIARIANHGFLAIVLEAIRTHVHGYLVHYARAVGDSALVIKRHRPILQAIIDQDTKQAGRLARAHVRASKSQLQTYVEAQQKTLAKNRSKWYVAGGLLGFEKS